MSTQIGNTTKAYGREYNISVSNIGGENILASDYLKENTIIIDSKIDNNLEDVGSYALFVTDINGKAVRLTYTIQPGSGLYIDPNDTDVIRMVIDENSIMADDGDEIYVNKHNIIDNYTLEVSPDDNTAKRGRIGVVTANLEKSSPVRWGITKGDENTTYVNYEGLWENVHDYASGTRSFAYVFDENGQPIPTGEISVNTQNLETVDDTYNRNGIVVHSSEMNRTIKAENGKLEVLTYNLQRADNNYGYYGIAIGDGSTITATSGVLGVITEGLKHSTSNSFGISKGDELTIHTNDGELSVDTQNLETATTERFGTVMLDGWSINTSEVNGKIEVTRFPEIESLLNTNNPEHKIFRADIEDLKNRVTKLETIANQELIELFTPVGDTVTELPMPVFDKETWSIVNKYTDRKTIAFQIKTNCKFYVNVDYKQGTNDYGQVTLLNAQLGNGETIPANSLANHIFESNDKKIQTLYFTFQVKNYDADNNIANSNTQVILTAASINDAAINQAAFHIFKCWNNKAYEEDKPEYPDVDPPITAQSYWIIEKGTEYLKLADNTYADVTNSLSYNKTGSKNFYFNTLVSATYFDGDPATVDPKQDLNQSSSDGNGEYDITVTCYENFGKSNQKIADWVSASVTASYNSTKKFNVLTVRSTKNINQPERTTDIVISLKNATTLNNLATVDKTALDEFKVETKPIEKIIDQPDKLVLFKDKINTLKLHTLSESTNSLLTVKNKTVANVSKLIEPTSVSTNAIQLSKAELITSDIEEFNTAYAKLETMIAANETTSAKLTNKTLHTAYSTYIGLINKYAKKIIKEYDNITADIDSRLVYDINKASDKKTLKFKYTEKMTDVTPIINVTSNIAYNGYSGIGITVSRNANSYLSNPDTWGVDIKYSFINKNGDTVDANGIVSSKEYEIPRLYPKSALTYTYNYSHADISTAATGYRTETTTSTTYYNVIAISIQTVDRGSLWGIGNWNKDSGIAYWGSYCDGGSRLSSITDDIYLTFKLTGQDAKISGQNYSYWSISLKGKANGYEEEFEQANEIEFYGLSKVKYTKSRNAAIYDIIKIGNNCYVLKNYHSGQIGNEATASTAAAEKTLLNSIAQQYFSNHKVGLVYKQTEVPVKVANNITGIKIKSVDITEGAFNMAPVINFNSVGSWKTNTGSNDNNPSNANYTFGNAKISSITIDPWDDLSMTIKLHITPGTATNIPNGSTIVETPVSNNGATKFTFLIDNKSYIHTQFYSKYQFSSTIWSNGCTVTYKLYNQYSLSSTSLLDTKETVYNKDVMRLQTVYVDDKIKYGELNTARNATYQSVPLLTNITGIKFWIGINTSSITVQKKFESSTSSMGVQVTGNGRYIGGFNKSVAIENALYNNTTKVTNTVTRTGGGSRGSTIQYNSYYGILK